MTATLRGPAAVDALLARLQELEPAPIIRPPFIDTLSPRIVRYRYVQHMCTQLQRVLDGEINNVMFFAPPRLGKSTIVAREFSAEWLIRFPATSFVLASYASRLAQDHARGAQDAFLTRGGRLAIGQAEKSDWKTAQLGGMLAVGIGSGLTGRGADAWVLDDSVADAEESASDAIARRNRDWYDSTLSTRSQGRRVKIIITTRWPGKADLAGYALEQESNGEPERWTIVPLDAERDETPWDFPETCEVVPDWRAAGELVCPERISRDLIAKSRARSGFFHSTLFQQRPKARDGVLFAWDDFQIVDATPTLSDLTSIVRYWDLAGTELRDTNDPDATSGVLMARHRDGTFWVLDRARVVAAVSRRDAFIRATADADRATFGSRVVQWFEQQSGIGGQAAMQSLARLLAGHRFQSEPATGSKELRAEPYAGQVQAKNVRLVKGAWNDGYRLEMCAFPFGAHDDDVDASSGSFAKCAGETGAVSVTSFSWG